LKGKLDESFIDAITLVLEHDSAYRYRFQDIIVNLNKYELTRNSKKELCRLMDMLIEREEGRLSDKWEKVKKFAEIALSFPTKIRRELVKILVELNLEELKFSKEDIYWTDYYYSYKFGGKSLEERKLNNKI
jgi:hypothetical protein